MVYRPVRFWASHWKRFAHGHFSAKLSTWENYPCYLRTPWFAQDGDENLRSFPLSVKISENSTLLNHGFAMLAGQPSGVDLFVPGIVSSWDLPDCEPAWRLILSEYGWSYGSILYLGIEIKARRDLQIHSPRIFLGREE